MATEPHADHGTRIMARAYAELSSCRSPGGMGLGPIPWTAMVKWCKYYGMERDRASHVIRVVRLVDNVMLRRAHAAAKAPPRKGR